jgi:hypothetical protein
LTDVLFIRIIQKGKKKYVVKIFEIVMLTVDYCSEIN